MRAGVSTVFAIFLCAVIGSACSEKKTDSTAVDQAVSTEQATVASIEKIPDTGWLLHGNDTGEQACVLERWRLTGNTE